MLKVVSQFNLANKVAHELAAKVVNIFVQYMSAFFFWDFNRMVPRPPVLRGLFREHRCTDRLASARRMGARRRAIPLGVVAGLRRRPAARHRFSTRAPGPSGDKLLGSSTPSSSILERGSSSTRSPIIPTSLPGPHWVRECCLH